MEEEQQQPQPHSHSHSLPAASTLRLRLSKEDLYRTVTKHKHLLHVGLRAAYRDFYLTAEAEETKEVERCWALIAEEVMSQCHWAVKRPVMEKPVLTGTIEVELEAYNASVLLRNTQLIPYLCSMDTVNVTDVVGLVMEGERGSSRTRDGNNGIVDKEAGGSSIGDDGSSVRSHLNPKSNISIEALRKAERKARRQQHKHNNTEATGTGAGIDAEEAEEEEREDEIERREEEEEDLAYMKEIEELSLQLSEAEAAGSSNSSVAAMGAAVPAVPDISTVERSEVVLRWSAVVFRRAMQVQSIVEGAADPLVTVAVWQRGNSTGVIGIHLQRG
jgi:hypothetical protein